MDEQFVHVVRERPSVAGECVMRPPSDPVALERESNVCPAEVTPDEACRKIVTLSIRANVVDEGMQAALSGGSAVTAEQVSPAGVQITCGVFSLLVVFPFPVDGTCKKLRIARKSLYVEVCKVFFFLLHPWVIC
jgi:hypothetical protein